MSLVICTMPQCQTTAGCICQPTPDPNGWSYGAEQRRAKDEAYLERNRLVALLASLYPSGIARTEILGWDPEWHGCVYIDLPTGQVSWHYHDSHAELFAHLPPYTKPWDGHDTAEKYARVMALSRPSLQGEGI